MTAQYDATSLTIPKTTYTLNGVGTIACEVMWGEAPKKLDDSLSVPVRVVLLELLDNDGVVRPDGYEFDLDELEFSIMAMLKKEMYNSNFGLKIDTVELTKRLSSQHWFFKINYKKNTSSSSSAKPDYDKAVENWDFSGTSQIVTQSKETVGSYGPSGASDAPNYKGLIGWDGTRIQGVSVEYAVCRMSLRFLKAGDEVDLTYKTSVYSLYNCVNSAEWRGFPAGTLRFIGGTMQEREDGDYDITFNFIPDKTHTYETVGLATGPIVVPPHHYMWAQYEPVRETVGTNNDIKKVQKAKYVFVDRVYEKGEFSALTVPA